MEVGTDRTKKEERKSRVLSTEMRVNGLTATDTQPASVVSWKRGQRSVEMIHHLGEFQSAGRHRKENGGAFLAVAQLAIDLPRH